MSAPLETFVDWMKAAMPPVGRGDVPVLLRHTLDKLRGARSASPPHDIYETETALCIVLDVPGATARNTRVAWDGTATVTVHVARARPSLPSPRVEEHPVCDWYREITVPIDVDGARATTSLQDGVLTVRLPKDESDGVEAIPVVVG